MNVAIQAPNGEVFPFIVAEQVEFLGQVLLDHHRLCDEDFLLRFVKSKVKV